MGVLVRSFCVLAIAACGGEEAARSLATSPAAASPAPAGSSSSPEDAPEPSSVRTLTGASLSGPHATRCAALQSHRALRERPEPPCEQLEASASGDRLDTVLARFGPSGPFEDVELVVVELGETDAPEGGECVLVARHEGRWYRDDLGDLCSNRGTARLSVEPTFSSLPSGRVRLDLLLRDEHAVDGGELRRSVSFCGATPRGVSCTRVVVERTVRDADGSVSSARVDVSVESDRDGDTLVVAPVEGVGSDGLVAVGRYRLLDP